jgi:hypothetical protein
MSQATLSRVVFLPFVLVLALLVVGPVMAKPSGKEGASSHSAETTKKGKMAKMHAKMGKMGLSMTNVMPGMAMKFLGHFKTWIEITPDQEVAWADFTKAIKVQATAKPQMMGHSAHTMDSVAAAEMKMHWNMEMMGLKKKTLEAYKALQKTLDAQQLRLAETFLAHHKSHKGHGGRKKGGHH